MGAVNPPAVNRRPIGTSGVCSFVFAGYAVKVAASGEFWFVRSGFAVGVGAGVPYSVFP
jgi:hypothetical protein